MDKTPAISSRSAFASPDVLAKHPAGALRLLLVDRPWAQAWEPARVLAVRSEAAPESSAAAAAHALERVDGDVCEAVEADLEHVAARGIPRLTGRS